MTAYLAETTTFGTHKADRLIVSAANLADAKTYCESLFGGEGGNWANATFTAIADVSSDGGMEGWRFTVRILDTDGALVEGVTVTGAADDGLDEIGAALVIALNATDSIANAGYAANVLTAAGMADTLGDHTLEMDVPVPIVNDASGVRENQDVIIAGYTGTIVHEGAVGAALKVDFPADTYARPTTYRRLHFGHVT